MSGNGTRISGTDFFQIGMNNREGKITKIKIK